MLGTALGVAHPVSHLTLATVPSLKMYVHTLTSGPRERVNLHDKKDCAEVVKGKTTTGQTTKREHERVTVLFNVTQLDRGGADMPTRRLAFPVIPLVPHTLFFCTTRGICAAPTFCTEVQPAYGNRPMGQQSPGRNQGRLCLSPPAQADTEAGSRGSRPSSVGRHARAVKTWLDLDSILCCDPPSTQPRTGRHLGSSCLPITTPTLSPVQGAPSMCQAWVYVREK